LSAAIVPGARELPWDESWSMLLLASLADSINPDPSKVWIRYRAVNSAPPAPYSMWLTAYIRMMGGARRTMRDPMRALIALQIAAILVVGVATVTRFHIFAVVDELPHLAYVQEVAEHGRLPWLGSSYVSWQELAIEQHTYPRPSSLNPRLIGFRGSSYEAWQPPLYYMLASPAFLIPENYRHKVFAVRAFDLLLLLATVAILAQLARAVFKECWLLPYCLALSTLLWPGVIVRAITVSNAALELPLVPLYVLALWSATARPRARSVVTAGGLAGLCVLTQLTLMCLAPLLIVPLVALFKERRGRAELGIAAFTISLPVVLVAPWLASNLSRYGALTANALLERMQEAYEPGTRQYGLRTVTSNLWRFTRAALPQEWWLEYKGVLGAALVALPTVLLLVGVLAVARRPSVLRSTASVLLAGPLFLGFATLVGVVLLEGWQSSFVPRFLNPMVPLFALFVVWAWMALRRGTRTMSGLAISSTAVAGVAWVCMAGAYYFTNVGEALGIR
jgi:hypothetical protein